MEPVKESYVEQWQRESKKHLEDAGETYNHHLIYTIKMGLDLLYTGLVLIVHGIVPAFFTRTASGRIERMYLSMKGRIGPTRLNEIETDWQI